MRVNLLGVMAVGNGATAVTGAELGGRRARIVLAMLATSRAPVGAETLAAAVWGDSAPPTWQVALRGTIRSLRTALAPLGGEVIDTVPSGYVLARTVQVDVREAEAGVVRAEQLLTEGRGRAALTAATAAAGVRGADLLPEEDAGWLAPVRAAIDATALRALDVAARAASAAGEHGRAIEAGRRAVDLAPLDERAHRCLIRTLALAGDRAGAVRAYDACRTVLADELGVDPSAETVATYLDVTADQARSVPGRIPAATTTFVGRDDEARRLSRALAAPGLVTLVGRGGVGKSRLAAEVAAGAGPAGQTFWLPLGAVSDDALVDVTAALQLEVDADGDPVEAIAGYLAPLGRTLLVLDGADVVTDGTATLAVGLVEACPMLTVLVTSRTPLDVDREQVLRLDPLPGPEGVGLLDDDPQALLLLDRVAAAGGTLTLDDATRPAVLDLCRRCDGLPLALELAAAQLADMALGDLLDQLGEQRPDRLRAVTASSCAHLDDDEVAVFRRFAVLDGPVGLTFARPVLAGDGVPPHRVARILRELGARGLVSVDRTGARWTYSQDDDVHRYARELLTTAGEERQGYDRLADAVRALLPADAREPPAAFAGAVSAVRASVRSLFGAGLADRADRSRCLELAFRLHRYWASTSVAEGRMWLGRLLEAAPDSPWRGHATYALGYLGYWAGDTDAALRDLRSAVEQLGDQPDPLLARALIYTAGLLDDLDRPAEALDHVRRAMVAAEPFGTDLYVAAAMGLGSVLSERADPDAARYAAEAVARCRADGSAEQLAALLPTAAMVCWQVGALDDARSYLAQAWPMHVDHKRIARVVLLSTAAGLALADGDVEAAIDHGRAADAEGSELGVEREMPLIRALLARALLRSGDVSDAAGRALAGVDAAAGMDVTFPLAIGLETAALVGRAAGADPAHLGALIATAAAIRARGDRPAPVPVAGDLARLCDDHAALDTDEAVALARAVLTAARGRR